MVSGLGKTFRMQIKVQVGGENKRFAAAEEKRKTCLASRLFLSNESPSNENVSSVKF